MSMLENLAAKHPYYCNESNYYSNEASIRYETMGEFLDEFEDADIDMNLCFRWDVRKKEDKDEYYAEVFIMGQRKGKFVPVTIQNIHESDCARFVAYLNKHYRTLIEMWNPISGGAYDQD